MKKNTPFKVMTASAIAATIAVPAVASSVSAAEVNIETVAIQSGDEVQVVTYTQFTDAYLDGEGEVYELATEGTIVSFSTDGESYISYQALVDALFDAPDGTTTADVIADLEEDEDAMVPADEVADYVPFGDVTVDSVSANTDLTTEVTTVEGTVSNLEALELEEGETATVTVSVFANGDTSVDPAVVNEDVEVDADGMFSTTFTGLPEGDHVVRVSLSEDVSTDAEFSIDLTDVNEAVDAVINSTNQVQLLEALQSDFFENVNEDLIADYASSIDGTEETVAEIQMDINTVNSVEAVLEADTQVELLAALEAGEELGVFTDVRDDYIVTYADGIIGQGLTTADEIQEVITDAEETVVAEAESALTAAENDPTDANVKLAAEAVAEVPDDIENAEGELVLPLFQDRLAEVEVVNAVLAGDAYSEIRLLAALEDNNFERVNPDFIVQYESQIGSQTTVEGIQDAIDAVNFSQASTEVSTLTNESSDDDFEAAKLLIDNLAPDEEDETAVSDLKAQFELQLALANVADLDSDSSTGDINEALTALSEASEDFDASTISSELLEDIAVQIGTEFALDPTSVDEVSEIQTIVVNVAVSDVDELTADSTDAEVTTALTNLGNVSEDFDNDTINSALIDDYRTAISTNITASSTAADVQAEVVGVNDPTSALSAIETTSTTDASVLLDLLNDEVLDLSNVNDDNADAYLSAISTLNAAATVTDSDSSGTIEADEVADARTALIDAIDDINNLVEANNATTATELRTVLNAIALDADTAASEEYINLSSAAKLEVAEAVLTARPEAGFSSLDEIVDLDASGTAALDTELTERSALFADYGVTPAGINTGTTAEVIDALNAYGLEAFTELSPSTQVDVAEYLVTNRPEVVLVDTDGDDTVDSYTGGYTTVTQIETAIEAALAQ